MRTTLNKTMNRTTLKIALINQFIYKWLLRHFFKTQKVGITLPTKLKSTEKYYSTAFRLECQSLGFAHELKCYINRATGNHFSKSLPVWHTLRFYPKISPACSGNALQPFDQLKCTFKFSILSHFKMPVPLLTDNKIRNMLVLGDKSPFDIPNSKLN